MLHETIYLSKERNVYLDTYIIENSNELQPGVKRPAVIICPGGGYSYLSDREAEPIALSFVAAGIHAFVLHYGIDKFAVAPGPLNDIAHAISYIRDKADEWFLLSNQVYVSGFSAGAHVAASLGVFWNNSELLPEYAAKPESIRPNGMILGYPVLDLFSTSTHLDIGIAPGAKPEDISFDQKHPLMPLEEMFVFDEKEGRYFIQFENAMNAYIFGGPYTKEQETFYSLQNQVSKDTPPAFIWHTSEDGLIKPANSLKFVTALMEHDIPYELHIFENGGHGLALANDVTANYPHDVNVAAAAWMPRAIAWLKGRVKKGENNV